MTDALTTIPPTESQASVDRRYWTCDLGPQLLDGDSIATATCLLFDIASGASYPTGLSGAATYIGALVTQFVVSLLPGHSYLLVFVGVTTLGETVSSAVKLECTR